MHKKVISIILCLIMVLSFSSIHADAASSFKITPQKVTMIKGTTKTIKVSGKKKIKWSSSNKDVAKVSSKGKVTAQKGGKAIITAKSGKIKKTCKVTVLNKFNIKLNSYTGTEDGTSHTISISGAPSGTKLYYRTNTKAKWTTEKPVREEVGVTTVYVKAVKSYYKNFTGSAKITIKEKGVQTVEEDGLALYLKVLNGKVYDLVSGKEQTGFTVDGDYIKTGTITTGRDLIQWTYEMILDYNENSTKGVLGFMNFSTVNGYKEDGTETKKYEECDNIFKLREKDNSWNNGQVRVPWVPDSYNSGYFIGVPVQLNSYLSTNGEILPPGDTFWSFSMDSKNGKLNSRIDGATSTTTMKSYTGKDGEQHFVNKVFRNSVSLTGEHKIKEIKIYDRALSQEEQKAHYDATGIEETVSKTGSSMALKGVAELGTLLYEKTSDTDVRIIPSEKAAGTHTFKDSIGGEKQYTLAEFENPQDKIDNSQYESVHITNKIDTLQKGKEYPLTAYAYPSTTADEYDVTFSSDNPRVCAVVDGLLIAKDEGNALITATLTGTDKTDSFQVHIGSEPEKHTNVFSVPDNYVSGSGNRFSDTDYAMTTNAIYDAIKEAKALGYNKVVFPKIKFYAQPVNVSLSASFKVPSDMTIEFPEGSEFHMMDNEISRGDATKVEIHYFEFAADEKDNPCENSHLIIDKFYGERFNTTHSEKEFLEENRFAQFGRKAVNCSIEIRNAYNPAGYFITADGTSANSNNMIKKSDMQSGLFNENTNTIEENTNWISSSSLTPVSDKILEDGYFLSIAAAGSGAAKYMRGCSARLYNIYWFDEDEKFISKDEFLGTGDYYKAPAEARYYRLSLQQADLPESTDDPFMAIHDDGSAKFCEIKNTNAYDTAAGLFSVVGETDGLWIHNCYTNRDGMKPGDERTGDFENGWYQMRHSVVSNNIFKGANRNMGYFGASGGFNTFFHTNYMTYFTAQSGHSEQLRLLNNQIDTLWVKENHQAHIYNNRLRTIQIKTGNIYDLNNSMNNWVRSN